MATIREAILLAADQIERHPEQFRFISTRTPDGPGCGTPGCAMGWVGHFAGLSKVGEYVGFDSVAPLMGLQPARMSFAPSLDPEAAYEFYNRMDVLCGSAYAWRYNASECARTLRLYADAHHPAPYNWSALLSAPRVADTAVSREVA